MSGQSIDLRVDRMSYGEDAVGRHDGKVIFCFGAVPGELVRARVLEQRRSFDRAVVENVLEAAGERVIPPCPYFGSCGGCHWQHVDYGAQVHYKTAVAREQLARIGGLPAGVIHETIPSPQPYHYRNIARFGVMQTDHASLGYRKLRSNDLVRIDHCFLLPVPVNRILFGLQDFLYEHGLGDVAELTLRVSQPDPGVVAVLESTSGDRSIGRRVLEAIPGVRGVIVRSGERTVDEVGDSRLCETLHGLEYQFSPTAFFQVNPAQAENLLRAVDAFLPASPGQVVLDAYSGAGFFSMLAARRAERVVAIEENPAAIRDARRNASNHGLANITFHTAPVERALPRLREHFTTAIVDPPRGGCHPAVLRGLIERQPRTVLYVSCSPPTLARDLRSLVSSGYRVQCVQPLDMFPQTYHIETVVLLSRV